MADLPVKGGRRRSLCCHQAFIHLRVSCPTASPPATLVKTVHTRVSMDVVYLTENWAQYTPNICKNSIFCLLPLCAMACTQCTRLYMTVHIYTWTGVGWDRLLYKFRYKLFKCTCTCIGQTRSSSTSQLSPNSSFSASSPNQSAYLSPERTYPSSTSLGASGSFNNSYDGGSKVSWTVGGSESVDEKVQNEPPSDSVTLQAGINEF